MLHNLHSVVSLVLILCCVFCILIRYVPFVHYLSNRKLFYCFYTKNAELFVMALFKREILTSCKVLHTKSCTCNQFLFCKNMLSTADFSCLKGHLKRKINWHSLFANIFQVSADKGMGNYSKLVELWTQIRFQIRACVISVRKAKHLDVTSSQACLYTLMQTLLLANQSAHTILVVFRIL